MSDIETRFNEAVDFIQNDEGDFRPSNELKLEFYGLYKQATRGDVSGKRPGMMDFVARAKHDAWASFKGLSAEQAMQKYVERVDDIKNG
jgi:acyl-CoA-binding protein